MQAVILVGGEGTRLRPLTSTVPKPIVPLVDRPLMGYMLEWLKGHGVDDVVMLMGYLATAVRNVLGDGTQYGMRIRYAEEPEPRGTGGALKFAESLLAERFLMLNGDVLTDMNLSQQLEQHERTGARATLALVPVEDPTAYGLVPINEDRSVREFVEKPSPDAIDTNLISAGAYVLEKEVVELIEPDRNVSIEREIWPQLVGDGLFAYPHEAYWLDIGTPERYLQATFDVLEGLCETSVTERLGDTFTVLGDGVKVGEGATIERAVVMQGSEIGAGCVLRGCVVAAGSRIGAGTQVTGGAVIGEGVTVGEDNVLTRGVRVFPHVTIPDGGIRF